MCYYISLLSEAQELEHHYGAELKTPYMKGYRISGFASPLLPTVLDTDLNTITLAEWGLIPHWAKNRDFQKNTINARIETLETLPSFRDAATQRCLIPINGFFEWQWQDEKGKVKKPFLITLENQPIFSLGGIFSRWKDPSTGKEELTLSVVTTEANPLMAEIHNTKKRMPVILSKKVERDWLDDTKLEDFAFPNYSADLIAQEIEK